MQAKITWAFKFGSRNQKLRLECSKIQGENWGKIIRDKEQEDAFNKRVNECTVEMIRNMSN